MSTYDDGSEFEAPEGQAPPEQGEDLKELREAAKRGREAKAEAEAAKRELAFVRAGVDLDTPQGAMFAKAYDGELDHTAIKERFAEVFGAPESATPPPAQPAAADPDLARAQAALQQETAERRDLSSVGTEHTPPPVEDPRAAAKEQFYEDITTRGMRREDAAAGVIAAHIAAANAGVKGSVSER